jgi:hypothetical protein
MDRRLPSVILSGIWPSAPRVVLGSRQSMTRVNTPDAAGAAGRRGRQTPPDAADAAARHRPTRETAWTA